MKTRKRDPRARHFSEELWADFARGVANKEARHSLQAHLNAGCEQCRATVDHFGAVARMAPNERLLAIPEEWVQQARAIASAEPASSGWIENLTVIVGHLIDTQPLDWQLAGVRSQPGESGPAGGRMVFRAADYAVYLKVEPLMGHGESEIVGEIVNERERGESMEGIPVQMVSRGQTLSESATNRFGEFLIGAPVRKNVTLRFALKSRGQRIDLQLKSLLETPKPGDRR